MRAALLACLLAGCRFQVEPALFPLEDGGAIDLPVAVDLAREPDDFAIVQNDLASPDMARPDALLALEPSGVAQAGDSSTATASPTITSDVTINTDDGSITGGLVRAAGAGVKNGIFYREALQTGTQVRVAVIGFAGLTLSQGATLRARGTAALAIVSSRDVTLAGTVLLQTCDPILLGAGAGRGGTPGANGMGGGAGAGGGGVVKSGRASGGGGAGHGDVGGAGGESDSGQNNGGTAGGRFGNLVDEPVVLVGGGGGGAGIDAGGSGAGRGGNGGGAIQIAVNGTLSVRGVIHAGGCGGRRGDNDSSAGGGGAGGAILLEAARVILSSGSVMAANGGAGGGASDGGDATASQSPAPGGMMSSNGGAGGAGGAIGLTAGSPGDAPPSSKKAAGGGGGGVGRVVVKTPDLMDQGALFSPALVTAPASFM